MFGSNLEMMEKSRRFTESAQREYILKSKIYTETAKEKATNAGSRDYSGSYIYLTFIDDPGIEVPLRSSQNVNSEVTYIIPNDSKVYVINKNHETYYRVYVNGHYGYVSKHLL